MSDIKNIQAIHLGFNQLDAWYWSPYPEEIVDKLSNR